jgi:hypothetical protein
MAMAVASPDLSGKPFRVTAMRATATPPNKLLRAWTEQFDRWFALPGSVLMKGETNTPFLFRNPFRGEEASALRAFPASQTYRLAELA